MLDSILDKPTNGPCPDRGSRAPPTPDAQQCKKQRHCAVAASVDALREDIASCLRKADEGEGVLVLTDMFGGTPSNLSLSFHDETQVEVVTGLNLPMLVKLATLTEDRPLEELAATIREYGRRNISVASELLPDKKGSD